MATRKRSAPKGRGRSSKVEAAPNVSARRGATHREPADQDAATELVLYIENTSDLSPDGPSGQGRSILLNALRKWRKGTYDSALAVKLFEYLTESGAKRYAKEMGSSEREWNTMFNPATRHEAAKQLEASFRNSVEHGEYDHVDTRTGTREHSVSESTHGAPVERSLYDELVAAGQEIDNHESDLYVKWTPEAVRIIKTHGRVVSTFKNQIDGKLWIDVPFAYDPWWTRRQTIGKQVSERAFTPELSGSHVGQRVEILKVEWASPNAYFKPGQFGYVVGQNTSGGMSFTDVRRDSKPGEVALLIAKSREMRGGALWFSLDGVRFTGRDRTSVAREADHSDRPISMTYGELPPFEQFWRDIRRPDPDSSDGDPYWPGEGTLYPMELVNSREIELAEEFGEFEEFRGQYGKRGFRGDERQIYDFLVFLMGQDDAYDFEEGGPADFASSIMTTLGYEWI